MRLISGIEYDFLKKFSDYIDLYKESNIPVVLCDGELNAGWRNPAAETLFPYITDKPHFAILLGEFQRERILAEIQSGGSLLIDHLVGISDVVLHFTPILKRGKLYGVVAKLMGPNALILKPKARLVAQTPIQIESGIRESVTEIFRAMDVASNMEKMLREQPEINAIGLDTGFISESFRSIEKQAYYLLRMAKNISVYSDLSANPPEPAMITQNVFGLVSRTQDAVKLLAAEMDIPLSLSLPEDGGMAGVDAEKFELAFFNILNNAFYFTRENNAVTVTGGSNDDEVFITVSDHGAGIPKEILPDIFEPYFARGHESKPAGIGLGLTIAKAMIEAQGGSIRVRSIKGKGTEVTISIPRGSFTNQPVSFTSSTENPVLDKFSYLFVGLKDAIRSPYNPKNKR